MVHMDAVRLGILHRLGMGTRSRPDGHCYIVSDGISVLI